MKMKEVQEGTWVRFRVRMKPTFGGCPSTFWRDGYVTAKKDDSIVVISWYELTWDYENRGNRSEVKWMDHPDHKPVRRQRLLQVRASSIVGVVPEPEIMRRFPPAEVKLEVVS